MTLLLWVFFQTGERLANHSRAIASKLFSVLAIRAAFASRFASAGSM